jgi:adenylate cyclase class IV
LLFCRAGAHIHRDDVKGLIQFMELEVVLHAGQDEAKGQSIAEDLMTRLGIRKEDLLDGAYMDLLEKSA